MFGVHGDGGPTGIPLAGASATASIGGTSGLIETLQQISVSEYLFPALVMSRIMSGLCHAYVLGISGYALGATE
jgi:Amt family ammonium transporter